MTRSRGCTRKAVGNLLVVIAAMLVHVNVAHGQLRIVVWGNTSSIGNVPTGFNDFKAIAAGGSHCLVLRSNGTVIAWGDNSNGQTNVPSNLTNAIAIAAGSNYSLALRTNGIVTGWGVNPAATPPVGLTNVIAIAAGNTHALALKNNGTVVAWGNNTSNKTNVPAGAASGVAAISAGDSHSLVLKSNGLLVAWGDNGSSQTNILSGVSNVMAIAAGYHHNLAVRSNGTVVAWMLSVNGETNIPPGLSGVVAVRGGYFYSMALKSDGTVVAWGNNNSGQTNVPAGLINVVAISTSVSSLAEYAVALTPSAVCPPGFPDNFECRQVIAGSNFSFSVSNVGATTEAGEPGHFDLEAGKSLWYSWTAPFTGGAVITDDSDFETPVLVVYTNTSLTTLTNVAKNSTTFNQARVVFNAVAGTTYQIVVDGTTFNGSSGEGSNYLTLKLTPPPGNDLFANRLSIPVNVYQTNGTFIGATQETGEPAHTNSNGDPAFAKTLWWSWAAPTNLGATAIPVRVISDVVSFPPNIGVYTGSSVTSLTNVPSLSSQTNGMMRLAGFVATAGTTYQIALGGLQFAPAGSDLAVGNDASPRFADYRLRLNIHGLVLNVVNVVATTNGDDSVSFVASAQVTNYGSASSLPLRILVTTNSGISVKGQDSGILVNDPGVVMITNFSALAVNQGVLKRIAGMLPPPTVDGNQTLGVGYGAYAVLQELTGTNWITMDEALVMFGQWPDLGTFGGPGGGVIRIDPSGGGSAFNPLTNVNVLGPASVSEGSTGTFTGRARYATGFQVDFTNTVWNTTRFSITNGLLTTGIVTSNSPVSLSAQYVSGTYTYTVGTNIFVLNLPPPFWTNNGAFSNQQFKVTLSGVVGRKHVIEAATNLSPTAVWVPLTTNVIATNGTVIFLDPGKATNFIRRFYRARESD